MKIEVGFTGIAEQNPYLPVIIFLMSVNSSIVKLFISSTRWELFPNLILLKYISRQGELLDCMKSNLICF